MGSRTYELHAEKIQRELDHRGWNLAKLAELADFHPSTLTRVLKNGEKASLETLLAIAKALNIKNHMSLVRGNVDPLSDNAPPAPSAPEGQPTLTGELTLTTNEITLKVSGPLSVITRITPDQLTAAWCHLYSPASKATVKKIQAGSIVITIHVDEMAAQNLLDSFLAWRLQYLGVYELHVVMLKKERDVFTSILSHYRFADIAMRDRFETRVLSAEQAILATVQGLQIIQLFKRDNSSLSLDFRLPLTANAAAKAAVAAANFAKKVQFPSNPTAETAVEIARGAARLARAAAVAARRAADDCYASPAEIISRAAEAVSAAEHAIDLVYAAFEVSGRDIDQLHSNVATGALEIAKRTYNTLCNESDVWVLRSTLLPRHIQEAGHYWNNSKFGDPPELARFPDDNRIEPQPTIYLDDDTFLNQPHYHLS